MPTMTTATTCRAPGAVGDLEALRTTALEVGRALAPVGALWGRTDVLSLNARVVAMALGPAGMPFAIVAEAVSDLATGLAELVDEIEEARAGIVQGIAVYTREERNLRWVLTAFELSARSAHDDGSGAARARADAEQADTLACLSARTGTEWAARMARLDPGQLDRMLMGALLEQRAMMAATLGQVHRLARALDRATESTRRLAELHGHFIGINALIEAAHFPEDETSLRALGLDLHRLTRDIAEAIGRACEQAAALVRLAGRVVDQVDRTAAAAGAGGRT